MLQLLFFSPRLIRFDLFWGAMKDLWDTGTTYPPPPVQLCLLLFSFSRFFPLLSRKRSSAASICLLMPPSSSPDPAGTFMEVFQNVTLKCARAPASRASPGRVCRAAPEVGDSAP